MTSKEFEIWLQRAESNLQVARLGKQEGVFLEDLCFEAQQAAEKALKALLIYLSGEYPKVHSFNLILMQLENFVDVKDSEKDIVELTDYAVQMRYPGDYYPVSEKEYYRALELADRAIRWVRAQIEELEKG
jgi:HEPN domain-containing protein